MVPTPSANLKSPFVVRWAATMLAVALTAVSANGQGDGATAVRADRGATLYAPKPDAIAGLPDITEKLGEKVPLNTPLIDSTGKPAMLGDWFNQGKPVVLMFVFHRCPLACPFLLERTSQRFRDIEDLSIGTDFNVVVLSIDPTDTPASGAAMKEARLNNYGREPRKTVEAGWAFLTAPDASGPRSIADAVGFPYRYTPSNNDYAHPSALFVLTPDGTISRYLYGMDPRASDLRLSLVEAGQGKIGTTMDKVMLWCFHFDPTKGSYTFAAWRLMQVGGFLSAGVVGLLLLRMLVVEWRRRFAAEAAAGKGGDKNAELAR